MNNIVDLQSIRQRLDDEDIIRRTIMRRMPELKTIIFVGAVNEAALALKNGSGLDFALQIGLNFARKHS